MLTALLLALIAAPAQGRFERFCDRSAQGRSNRGLQCDSLAYFEFAPASGAGMGAACACAAVAGAKGEAVGWTRASSAYCTKEGLATTGLTTTSMVNCGNNLPRVSADGSGVLGVLVENTSTNRLLRSEEFDNVAWTSTATVTANTTTSPWNAAVADTLSDVSGVVIQSSCQTFVTASASRFTSSVYLTAGTLAKASIRQTGTGNAAGDCVTSTTTLGATYTRLSCSSAAAYTGAVTAVTVCVEVGTVVGDTGTIIATGAQLEIVGFPTSYIPTTTAVATRTADTNTLNGGTFPGAPFSLFASVTPEWSTASAPVSITIFEGQVGVASGAGFFINTAAFQIQTINAGALVLNSAAQTFVAGTAYRAGAVNESGNSTIYFEGSIVIGPTARNNTAAPWDTDTGIGYGPSGVARLDGIISRVCLHGDGTRCR